MLKKLRSLLLENRGTKQTIAKNIFWLSLSQVGSRLIRAIIIIYAARILGAAEYGLFSYALGLAGFFTVFTDLGVGQVMTREIARDPSKRSAYFATGFWIKTILLLSTALFIALAMPHLSNIKGANVLMPFIALLVIFDGLREFAMSLFRALEKMEWEALVAMATNILITVTGFIVLYSYNTAKILTATYVLSVGLGAIIAILIVKEEFSKIFSHYNKKLIKPIASVAIPIALSATLGAFMLNTDFVMLGWWVGAEDIGYYSAGQKIVQFLFVLPAILASALFPTLSRMIGQNNKEKIKELMEKSLAIAFLVALPLVIGGILLGKPLIALIYGQEYLPAVFNFQVLLLTILLTFPGVLIGNSAIALDKQKEITKYLLAAAIANVLFDVLLIPMFGIVGSSIATIISLTIDVVLCWRLIKKINNFYVLYRLKRIIPAAVIMGAISFVFNKFGVNIMANIIVSALIYIGLLYSLREGTLEELKPLIQRVKA